MNPDYLTPIHISIAIRGYDLSTNESPYKFWLYKYLDKYLVIVLRIRTTSIPHYNAADMLSLLLAHDLTP